MIRKTLLRITFVMLASSVFGAEPKGEAPANVPPDHAERIRQGIDLFKQHVRPALTEHCLNCHGGESVKADFDLATRAALMESGYVEATAADSYLVALITHAEEPHMPLKTAKLPEKTIDHIRRWIDLGAPYDKPLVEARETPPSEAEITDAQRAFWSFQPLAAVKPPAVNDDAWCRTPIDRFVRSRQQQLGLRPNPPAAARTLVRRAFFDLIGLPPTPDEMATWVARLTGSEQSSPSTESASEPTGDEKPLNEEAYAELIDHLLGSDHYGERWARHWLDVARFAESHGYEQDYNRPHAYHYRDFVIKALNDDMPYDQFVRWQLAGDELAPDEPLALMATGFLGAGAFPTQLTEAEFERARYDELDDMVGTTGVAFLGLSVGCARCHDHKFDPIPSRDYYHLAATFTTAIRSEIELELDAAQAGEGQDPKTQKVKVQVTSEGFPHMKHHADGRGFPHFYPQTHFLLRGDVDQKQEVAGQGFLRVLTAKGKNESYWRTEPPEGWTRTSFRRTALANWITDTRHGAGHLAARVAVNRLWQHHFGRGLVASPNDFGLQGERPTHPQLLDWLAADLIAHDWKLKRLHKLIMTSSVYLQSGEYDEARARIDRENRFLWRRAPRRLEGEAIRDSMLAVSGQLDTTMFGPGTLDPNMRRRSVYFFIKRSQLIPMMMLFDWPEHLVSIGARANTTIAPQALALMNSPQGRRAAESLAGRLPADEWPAAVRRGYELALGRSPNEPEIDASVAFLDRQQELYAKEGRQDGRKMALTDFCQTLLSMNEFVYVD